MCLSRAGVAVVAALVGAPCMQTGHAQAVKSGQQVHKEVCGVCHNDGLAKAPKLSDKKAWEPLISEGQAVLTAHGWV